MNQPPERDSSGRFVKPEVETPLPGDETMHPMSRLLFGWVSSPRVPILILIVVVTTCIGLLLLDFGLERHEKVEMANANGFYALWGFAAFGLAVLSGWPLGRLLRRDEDYYGEADTKPDDVEHGS